MLSASILLRPQPRNLGYASRVISTKPGSLSWPVDLEWQTQSIVSRRSATFAFTKSSDANIARTSNYSDLDERLWNIWIVPIVVRLHFNSKERFLSKQTHELWLEPPLLLTKGFPVNL